MTRDAALARVGYPPGADLHQSSAILACALFNMAAAVVHVHGFPDTTFAYSVSGAASARELKTAALGYPSTAAATGGDIVVRDATDDPYFHVKPPRVARLPVRFFARYPLLGKDGVELGALYLFDTRRRPAFGSHKRALLTRFTAHIAARIDAEWSLHFRDPLTGLGNRRCFIQEATQTAAAQADGDEPLWAVLIDVCPLEYVSRLVMAVGLAQVERVILRMTARITGLAPADRKTYRLGLARFAFFHRGTQQDAGELALRCMAGFDQPIHMDDDLPLSLVAHAGIMPVESHGIPQLIGALFAVADGARHRRVPIGMPDGEIMRTQRRHVVIINSIRGALQATDQLRLVYQPRERLSDGTWTSVEALLRWDHPSLGSIPPAEFIPLVEDTSLMPMLTDWVLEHALAQLGEWRRTMPELKVSINVSASDLRRPDFGEQISRLMDINGIGGACVELELTERSIVRAERTVLDTLAALTRQGIHIAIDDFGAGYSNLSQLSELPFDVLKLDNALVRAAPGNARAEVIARTVVALAKQLGHRVVAEGIETEALKTLATQWGCDEVQGYFVAKPMDAQRMSEMLRGR